MNILRWLKRLRHFVVVDIWQLEKRELSLLKAFVFRQSRILVLIGKDIVAGSLHVRAATLTYRTLLSIIPFFALMFVIATVMGVQQNFVTDLIPTVTQAQASILNGVVAYIEKTDVKALGYVGVVFLLWVSLSLVLEVGDAFNEIWGIKQRRNWLVRIGVSLLLLLIFPAVLLTATMLNAFIASGAGALPFMHVFTGSISRITQYSLVGLAFAGLYVLVPNTRVRFKPALIAGLFASFGWYLVQWIFLEFQVGVSRYNALYGTFASLPLFLLWMYTSWYILLAGCEFAFATQNEQHYAEEKFAATASNRFVEHVGLGVYYFLFQQEQQHKKPSTSEQIAHYFGAPIRVVESILFQLQSAELLCMISQGNRLSGYFPAKNWKTVCPLDIIDALKNSGSVMALQTEAGNAVMDKIHVLEKEARELLAGTGYAIPFSALVEHHSTEVS